VSTKVLAWSGLRSGLSPIFPPNAFKISISAFLASLSARSSYFWDMRERIGSDSDISVNCSRMQLTTSNLASPSPDTRKDSVSVTLLRPVTSITLFPAYSLTWG